MKSFDEAQLIPVCDKLARKDADIRRIIKTYGYPPLWTRKPCFETLVHIILEQQVSLASAKAALVKLKETIGVPTPVKILAMSDAELRACYFSRQKASYVKCLSAEIAEGRLSVAGLRHFDDEVVRERLTCIKGIGNWTVDVFLMMALHRSDLFPTGDIALMNSVRYEKQLPHATKEEILQIAGAWRPYRTVAAFIFWHAYIKRRNIVY